MKLYLLLAVSACLALAAPAIAEQRILFEDSFDQPPADAWSWLREDPDSWRIKDSALEIRVEPGKADSVKNALRRTAPDRTQGAFAVEVTVTFTGQPTTQYEQGGITWYHDGRPVMKLVHEHIDGETWIIPGQIAAPHPTVDLRLVVDGTKWTAQYRDESTTSFITTGKGELPPPGNDQISLQCYDGPPHSQHWIRFDNFRIVSIDP